MNSNNTNTNNNNSECDEKQEQVISESVPYPHTILCVKEQHLMVGSGIAG